MDVAKFSETKYVQARLRPDVAIVTKNKYTDIIRLNKPVASEPILFETYILNIMEMLLVSRAVIVSIRPLIINFFTLSPFNFINNKLNLWYLFKKNPMPNFT